MPVISGTRLNSGPLLWLTTGTDCARFKVGANVTKYSDLQSKLVHWQLIATLQSTFEGSNSLGHDGSSAQSVFPPLCGCHDRVAEAACPAGDNLIRGPVAHGVLPHRDQSC